MTDFLIFLAGAVLGGILVFWLCLKWFVANISPLAEEMETIMREIEPGVKQAFDDASAYRKLRRAKLDGGWMDA